jgi:hypothetical protein
MGADVMGAPEGAEGLALGGQLAHEVLESAVVRVAAGFGAHDGDAHVGEQVPVGVEVTRRGVEELLATGLLALPLPFVIGSLLVMVSGVAATTPPATTLALAGYPRIAGTASSLLGMARFGFGGVSAPFVGIAGVVTTVSVALAVAAYFALLTRRGGNAPAQPPAEVDCQVSAA